MSTLYTASVTCAGGRQGRITSSDGTLDLATALPQALGGDGEGTNPEQLLAGAYAACFLTSLKIVAADSNLDDVQVTAHVSLNRGRTGQFGLSVALHVALPMLTRAEAQRLLLAADKICPFSLALRNNVEVSFVVSQARD